MVSHGWFQILSPAALTDTFRADAPGSLRRPVRRLLPFPLATPAPATHPANVTLRRDGAKLCQQTAATESQTAVEVNNTVSR